MDHDDYSAEIAGYKATSSPNRPDVAAEHARDWYKGFKECSAWIKADTYGPVKQSEEHRARAHDERVELFSRTTKERNWLFRWHAQTYGLDDTAAIGLCETWAEWSLMLATHGYDLQPSRPARLSAKIGELERSGWMENIPTVYEHFPRRLRHLVRLPGGDEIA